MAEYLKFVVKGQKLELKGSNTIYSDTISYIGANFLFDNQWDGLTKVFHLQKDGETTVYDIMPQRNTRTFRLLLLKYMVTELFGISDKLLRNIALE